MMILSDLGAGAWDAMYVGLSESVGLTVGSWVFLIGVLLIIINSLLMKTTPDFLAIITIVIIGALIDFWLLSVFHDFLATELGLRIFMLTAGILIIGLGYLYVSTVEFCEKSSR